MNRYIFTDNRPTLLERIGDYIIAVAIGLTLTVLALSYFDVLTK